MFDSTVTNTRPTEVSNRLRSILTGSAGNLVEWYDFYAYAAFSLYFAKAFFPEGDETAQLLNSAAIFAFGFLMRPLGAWFFGRLADRHGRRRALTASVLLMCFGSALIALVPTYASIGVAAPILLLCARMLQGFSLGGEYGTSATYLAEIADQRNRGFYSSFQYVTLIGGQLLAMLVLILLQKVFLTDAEISAWGWRIPFVIGALLAVVTFIMRRNLAETDEFRLAQRHDGSLSALLQHSREIGFVIGLTLGGTVAFYTFTTYMQKFLANSSGFSKPTATLITASALVVFMLLQPAAGALSDRTGRKPVLAAFGIVGALGAVPLLSAIQSASDPVSAFLLLTLGLAVLSAYTAINAVVKAELFPVEVRALGVGFPYALTVALFGGTAEFVALAFKQAGHESWFFVYVAACIAVSLVTVLSMPETRGSLGKR